MLSLKLESIAKSFGTRRVFKEINFEVRPGQCCGIVGPNGSGKSTLLKIAADLISPTSGRIKFLAGDKEVPSEKARQNLFWIAPDLEFYGELTALENLSLFARIRGLKKSKPEITEKINRVGLAQREDDQVGSYSTGMKQRLKFALALVCEPEILLLDEPGSNLDQQGVEFVDGFIKQVKPDTALCLATNNPEETKYADFFITLG
jgi:heme exporter protein A